MSLQFNNRLFPSSANGIRLEKYPEFERFYHANQNRFFVTIYEDNTSRPIEQEFEVAVTESQALFMFRSPDDVTGYSLHLILHRYLSLFWKDISVPKNLFTPAEIDFLEDIFIQSVVAQIAPHLLEIYIEQIRNLNLSCGIEIDESVLSLMKTKCHTDFVPIKLVHEWLYSIDNRLNPDVFEKYAYLFSKLKNTKEFKNFVSTIDEAQSRP